MNELDKRMASGLSGPGGKGSAMVEPADVHMFVLEVAEHSRSPQQGG